MDGEKFKTLFLELADLPSETEWVEVKHNKAVPEEIGEYISALSNSAALYCKPRAYLLWGIDDQSHQIVGTTFRPRLSKVGNEELENWLLSQLEPRTEFLIHESYIDGYRLVMFEIHPAMDRPVRFRGVEYIRVGSYKKKLHEHPERERKLWRLSDHAQFAMGVSKVDVNSDDVLSLINYPGYFELIGQPLPDNRQAILEKLSAEKIIIKRSGRRYDITNLGAVLFATNLQEFDRLARKALRVIIYRGDNRVNTIKEMMGQKGYAVGFAGAIQYINDQLPQNEQIGETFRQEVRMYPEIAVRELVVNALIHQDFSIRGAGPIIEIFPNRMEISNPGTPLIDTLRFIDEPPCSRNETLAALMRRMGICEERGSGIDKVIFYVEMYQLPAPDFRVTLDSTVAVLYGPRDLAQMDRSLLPACVPSVRLRQTTDQCFPPSAPWNKGDKLPAGVQNHTRHNRYGVDQIPRGRWRLKERFELRSVLGISSCNAM